MEIFEKENGRFDEFHHLIERNKRVFGEVLRIFGIEWKCRPGPSQCCSSFEDFFWRFLAI